MWFKCKEPFLGEGNYNVTRKKWLHERLSLAGLPLVKGWVKWISPGYHKHDPIQSEPKGYRTKEIFSLLST